MTSKTSVFGSHFNLVFCSLRNITIYLKNSIVKDSFNKPREILDSKSRPILRMNASRQSAVNRNLDELEQKIGQALSYTQHSYTQHSRPPSARIQPQLYVEYLLDIVECLLDIKGTVAEIKAELNREPAHELNREPAHELPEVITIASFRAYETCYMCHRVLPELQRSDMRQRDEQEDHLASAICRACLHEHLSVNLTQD